MLLLLVVAACGGGGGGGGGSSSSGAAPSGVVVTIAPTSASVAVGAGSMGFSATVANTTNIGVSWQVSGVTGGNATVGTISTNGDYSAPASLPTPATVTVTAVSHADPTKTASAAVSLTQPTVTAPSVPTGLAASTIATSSVTLTWTASNNPGGSGVGGYYLYRDGTQIATVTGGTSYTNAGLTALTTYSYQVAAFDQATPANVSALSAALSVTTLADTQAPTVPSGLAASSVATGAVTLTWNASTDLPNSGGTGVGGYYLYRDGTQIATVTGGTSYTNAGLAASTTYSYQVAAFDQATPANVSALSAALSVTTLADTQAPTVPTGLRATSVTSTTATLGWNTSADLPNPGGTGVGGYYLYRNGTQIATVTSGTSYTNAGLTALTTYSYQVSAFDKATPANVSALSAALSVTAGNTLTIITPRTAALTLSQTQQFTTNAGGGTTLNWSVGGVAGGNSIVGTITSGGLYTPPASAGTHTVRATNAANSAYTVSATVAVTDLTGITTYHNDVARTGQNLQEYALTPTTVSSGYFGKRWSCPLDGTVYAQPLYVANLSIGGGTHNVLFVVTMHDSIYAFDADNPGCVTYWQVSFISPSAGTGITTISSANAGCNDTLVEYGITGTPVIDPNSKTIYLVAATTDNGTNFQRLHALDIRTGAEKANSPAVIQATVPGTGDGGTTVTFNPLYQNQRLGLTLSGGGVIIGWSSHCDNFSWPWHGWIMRYDATSLAQTAVFNDTPNGTLGGIWMSGGAPALDSSGNMFFSTGNGSFDGTNNTFTPPAPNNDYGESFVNLSPSTLAVQDFYTPSQNVAWTDHDYDLSTSGITVLPDGVGPTAHPNVLVGSDKQGHLWMIDRNFMSGFSPIIDNTVQYLTLPNTTSCTTGGTECVFATPAYWSGTVYIATAWGPVMALQLSNGLIPANAQVAIAASQSADIYAYPTPTPVISAAPSSSAIVWALDNNANGTDDGSAALGPAILRAYDATNLATTLYSSDMLSADTAGNAGKFTLPVVANGHVYVVGTGALTVYGLAP
jgi:chitodextrinase